MDYQEQPTGMSCLADDAKKIVDAVLRVSSGLVGKGVDPCSIALALLGSFMAVSSEIFSKEETAVMLREAADTIESEEDVQALNS